MGKRFSRALRGSFLFAALAVSASALAADTVIRDVRIEIGDGRVIENGSVLIHDAKIAAVGVVETPSAATVIDGKGLTVYPGFIDAYSTRGLKIPDAPAAQTAPSTSTSAPPTMWQGNRKSIRGSLKAADCLSLGSTAEDARKNGVCAALLCPGSGIIRGSGALALMTDEKQTASSFGLELSFRGTGGGGPGGGGGGAQTGGTSTYPGSLLGFIALLRQTLYDAQAYVATKPEKEDADLKGIATVFGGTGVIAADTVADISRALRLSSEFGFKAFITGGRDGYKMTSELGTAFPVLASISIGSEPSVTPSNDGPPAPVLEERRDLWNERAGNIQKMIEAGVPVAFSSEGDGVGSYLANVRKLISRGLKREDALKAMTATPASLFGMSDWGSVKAGGAANLVVMTGDFADAKSMVKMVFVNGKKFEVSK